VTTKICIECQQKLPLEKFHWAYKKKNLKQARCRKCSNARKVAQNKINRKDSERNRKKEKELREEYSRWKYYQECIFCGEDDPDCLDLHHVVRSEKKYSIARAIKSKSRPIIKNEVNKCVVSCKNDHARIHNGKRTIPPGTANAEYYIVDYWVVTEDNRVYNVNYLFV